MQQCYKNTIDICNEITYNCNISTRQNDIQQQDNEAPGKEMRKNEI